MKILSSTKTMIAVAIMGLSMSFVAFAHGETHDAGGTAQDGGISGPVTPAEVAPPKDVSDEPSGVLPPKEVTEAAISDTVEVAVENQAKEEPVTTARELYDALKAGKWLVAFGGILMFLVWGIRATLSRFNFAWSKGELAGNMIAFGTAFVLAIGTALAAGQGLSLGLLTAAAGAAWAAKGTWSHVQAAKEGKK